MSTPVNVLEIRPDGRTRWEMPAIIWHAIENYGLRHQHENVASVVDRLPKGYRDLIVRTEFPYPIPAPEPEASFIWLDEQVKPDMIIS